MGNEKMRLLPMSVFSFTSSPMHMTKSYDELLVPIFPQSFCLLIMPFSPRAYD